MKLEEKVGELLKAKKLSLSTAESGTEKGHGCNPASPLRIRPG